MKLAVIAVFVVTCALLPSLLTAQDQTPPMTQPSMPMHHDGRSEPMGKGQMKDKCQQMMQQHQQMMQQMKQWDQDLQQKVQAMNQASDLQQKVQAMQDVINTMVQQRHQMFEHMMQMHQRIGAHMMDHMGSGQMNCPAMQGSDGAQPGKGQRQTPSE